MPKPFRTIVPRGKAWLVAVLVSLAFWSSAFFHWERTGFGDWQWFHHMWETGWVSLWRFREFPLWNPYQCGGADLWGNPQTQLYSPFWWVTGLVFGTTLGHKLYLVLHTAVGLVGSYGYARRVWSLRAVPASFASALFCFSGTFVWDGAGGHATFLAFYFAPWLLLAWREAAEDVRFAALTALILGLTMAEAATYPPLYFLLLLAFESLAMVFARVPLRRLLRAAVVAGGLSLLLSAFRLVPILRTLRLHDRAMPALDHMSSSELLAAWTTRSHPWTVPGHPYVWAEYGAYVGWGAVVLAATGIGFGLYRRRYVPLVAGLLLFAAYAMGAVADGFPWPVTHTLPFFRGLRVPSRFLVFATFYLALLAGLGAERLHGVVMRMRALGPWRPALLPLLLFLALVDLVSVNAPIADRWRGNALPAAVSKDSYHLIEPQLFYAEYASYPRRNVGTSACHDEVPWPISRELWVGEGPQARLGADAQGRILSVWRSPQQITLEVDLKTPGRVHINQNHAAGWRSSVGDVVNEAGLLALSLPAGKRLVRLRYLPKDLPWSVLATLVGLVAALWVAFRKPRQSPR